ncbi:LytR C-terminal domain-containing protein [Streptomyces sp. NPDC088354]|uniref:LytR C-terminal domain-containing protein n=1 Tax=unclassified Streptomyces TaxID=2593676 RepID=UPI0029BCFF3F|nr:LytR C-terminal domain-containing protein [Streptomyces sp. MI02-7b]MDX3076763.1 LytR C-terminal domain-containing protein [Streptomyces sp. MI02-7b]
MSMLTPPGMGGKYRVTGNQYPRMRRPRSKFRIVTVLVTTVAVLGLAGWGTLQLVDVFDGDAAAKGKPAQAANASKERACKAVAPAPGTSGTKPIVFPEPGQLTVNVYNATAKSGLAKKTADQLAARGFKIGTFGNADPEYDRKVTAAALLLGGSGTKAEAAMKLVGAQFKGTTTYKPAAPKSKHAANTVDLMLGKGFTTLAADRVVERNLVVLAKPSAAPRPAGC